MNPIITCKLQNLYGSADRHKEPSGIQAMFISGSRANQIRSIPNPLCWQIAEEVGAKRRLHKWNVCKAMSLLCWNIPRPRNPPWLLKHGRISIIEFSNSSQHPPWWFVRPLVSLFPKGSHPWTSSAFVAQFTDPWKSISVVLTSDIFGYIWPCVCSSWTSLLEALPIRLAGLSSPESQITNTTSSCSKDRICRDCPCWTLEALETLWSFCPERVNTTRLVGVLIHLDTIDTQICSKFLGASTLPSTTGLRRKISDFVSMWRFCGLFLRHCFLPNVAGFGVVKSPGKVWKLVDWEDWLNVQATPYPEIKNVLWLPFLST